MGIFIRERGGKANICLILYQRREGVGVGSNVDLEALSRRWNLSSYDAAYLDLALRNNVPLASIDRDLKKTAAAQGIEVVR